MGSTSSNGGFSSESCWFSGGVSASLSTVTPKWLLWYLSRQTAWMAKRPSLRSGCFFVEHPFRHVISRKILKMRHNLPSKYWSYKSSPPKCTPEADADTHASWLGIINGHSICHGQIHANWGCQKCPTFPFSDMNSKKNNTNSFIQIHLKSHQHERKMPSNPRVNLTILIWLLTTNCKLPSTWIVCSTINVCYLWYSEKDISILMSYTSLSCSTWTHQCQRLFPKKNSQSCKLNSGHYITNPNNALLQRKSFKFTIHLHQIWFPKNRLR